MKIIELTNKKTNAVVFAIATEATEGSKKEGVLSTHPTKRKALNALKRLQANPTLLRLAEYYANGVGGSVLHDYATGNYISA